MVVELSLISVATAAQNANAHAGIKNYNGSYRLRVTTSGCQVNGTFISSTKTSGYHIHFQQKQTHDLVHSSIEGPPST